ncbi:diguanylate cyclase, partial [Agrobacterium sp. S2]|nr:diguanylate cyclase [Agrobacterium sp. S2]
PHLNRPDRQKIVTVSLGIAVSGDGREIIYEMVNQADMALYEAKRQGRDRLVLASGHMGMPAELYGVEAMMSG